MTKKIRIWVVAAAAGRAQLFVQVKNKQMIGFWLPPVWIATFAPIRPDRIRQTSNANREWKSAGASVRQQA